MADIDNWDDNPDWSNHEPRALTDAERLVVARAKLGLSQQKLAELLRIPVATLRNWEQGRTEPDGSAKTLIFLLNEHPAELRAWLSAA